MVLLSGTPSVLAASKSFQNAQLDFENKRYHAAFNEFSQAAREGTDSAEVYYWLGRSLVELKDPVGARKMYEAAFKVDPFGKFGRSARAALMNLTDQQAALAHPTDGARITEDTIRVIDRQAADLRNIKILSGNVNARYRMNLGDLQARKLGYYRQGTLQNFRDPYANYDADAILRALKQKVQQGLPYTPVDPNQQAANLPLGAQAMPGALLPNGGLPFNGALPVNAALPGANLPNLNQLPLPLGNRAYGRADVSNMAFIRSSWQRTDAQVQAMKYQAEAIKQAAYIQESANNLESLMSERRNTDAPHLRALGTSLYVRNYQDDSPNEIAPEDPPLQLKAMALKLSDQKPAKPGKLTQPDGVAHSKSDTTGRRKNG
jgi:hypothetical protein